MTLVIGLAAVFAMLAPYLRSVNGVASVVEVVLRVAAVACPLAVLFSARGFDLSVGAVYAFVPILSIWLSNTKDFPPVVAIAFALATAVAVGAANGTLSRVTHLPTLVVTLLMLLGLRSASFLLTGGIPEAGGPATLSNTVVSERLFQGVTVGVLLSAVLSVSGAALVARSMRHPPTSPGASMSRDGPSPRAIRLLVLTAGAAAIAGLLHAAELGSISSDVGQGLEVSALCAVLLGASTAYGSPGHPRLPSVIAGCAVIALLQVGLTSLEQSAFVYELALVPIVFVTVLAHRAIEARRRDCPAPVVISGVDIRSR